MKGTFRSLAGFNYRVWALGALVSNIGTWMQRTAQDWLVLTQLSDHDATSLGVVVALQFAPQVMLLPLTGLAADRLDRRRLLMVTQAAQGLLALGLGVLTLSGAVLLWHVYGFALILGCVSAFDAPARATFVSDLVVESDLSNAVALNSTSFNAARMIGPAVAGVLISRIGSGWVFALNGASFGAVLLSLSLLRVAELHLRPHAEGKHGGLVAGFRYVGRRPDLVGVLLMLALVGTFGLNFPVFISTMSVIVFRAGADKFGLLTSTMAVGSVTGALLSARRERPHLGLLIGGAATFGVGFSLASVAPNYWLFGAALAFIGIAAQTFTTSASSLAQLSTEASMRGRVMAILLAIAVGGISLGSPILGWVANHFGPRWSLRMGAASGFSAALVGLYSLWRSPGLPARHDAAAGAPRIMGLRSGE